VTEFDVNSITKRSQSHLLNITSQARYIKEKYIQKLFLKTCAMSLKARRPTQTAAFECSCQFDMSVLYITGADGGKVNVQCDRQWSTEPRHRYHVLSTTSTPTTSSQPITTSSDVTVTSSTAVRPPVNENRYATSGEDGNWSLRGTLERPPLDGKEDNDDVKISTKKNADSAKTVKHWVKYSDEPAGPAVYRELSVDLDDEHLDELHDDRTAISREYHHHLHSPSDAVLHVHHIHEVHDDGMLVVDVEAAKRSASATVALDSGELVTERTSSGVQDLQDSNEPRAQDAFIKYNVEEGLETTMFFSS